MVFPLFPSCRRRQLGQTESGARWSSLLPAGAQMMQPGPTSSFLQAFRFPSKDPALRNKRGDNPWKNPPYHRQAGWLSTQNPVRSQRRGARRTRRRWRGRSGGGRGRHWLRKFSPEESTQPIPTSSGRPALPLSLRPKDRRSTATKLV